MQIHTEVVSTIDKFLLLVFFPFFASFCTLTRRIVKISKHRIWTSEYRNYTRTAFPNYTSDLIWTMLHHNQWFLFFKISSRFFSSLSFVARKRVRLVQSRFDYFFSLTLMLKKWRLIKKITWIIQCKWITNLFFISMNIRGWWRNFVGFFHWTRFTGTLHIIPHTQQDEDEVEKRICLIVQMVSILFPNSKNFCFDWIQNKTNI